ncbi:MAG: ribose-phosphate diphosphokinase [Alphaproteobacteria bacterium]|nr:ribose-phosphate diphosphokinase [Alphaproteobacteria bacterium]
MKIIYSKDSENIVQKITDISCNSFIEVNMCEFSNGEFYVENFPVIKDDAIVIANLYPETHKKLVETLFLIEAIKRVGADKITLLLPYMPYSRQDKNLDKGFSGLRTIINMFRAVGVSRIIAIDLHSEELQNISSGIEIEDVVSVEVVCNYIRNRPKIDMLVAADGGRESFIKKLSRETRLPYLVLSKIRKEDGSCKSTIIEGDIDKKSLLVIDDIIDTGHTLSAAATTLFKSGAKNVDAFVTHGLLAKESLDLVQTSGIRSLTITDTVNNMGLHPTWVNVVSIVNIITEIIKKKGYYETRLSI